MKILLVGGGSGGPVAPLLAVAEAIKKQHPKTSFLLVGSKNGPEAIMAKQAGIDFLPITSGKWRRYFSWQNFASPFETLIGFFQAFKILNSFRPDCVFGAGSFVQVPVVWAAWFKKIPVALHQQDVMPSLANRICQLAAQKISVTFQISLTDFPSNLGLFYKTKRTEKVVLTGNPFREELKKGDRKRAEAFFNLRPDMPTLLVLGGGTGAVFLNEFIIKILPSLTKTVQVIHSTGPGKFNQVNVADYHPYEFIANMADAYAAADIVLARAGLSTITELSNLKKVSIIVPLPESHQEINGSLLFNLQAALVLEQDKLTPAGFVTFIRKLLFEHEVQKVLVENIDALMPKDSADKIANIIIKLAEVKLHVRS